MAMHSSMEPRWTSVALRASGNARPVSCWRISPLRGPSMRTIASALRPTGVAGATMVSSAAPLLTSCSRRALGLPCFLGGAAKDDGDALVETVAARFRRHFRVVLQREVNDAPLDRTHGRQELLEAIAADAVGDFPCLLPELFDALLLELLAIELDVFLQLPADQGLVRQDLNGVEQLAVAVDDAAGVAAIQPHNDLRLVLLGAQLEVEAGPVGQRLAPLAYGRGVGRPPSPVPPPAIP